MKDKIFIAWSGSTELAKRVKKILEAEYNYVCIIGGNTNNDSNFASISDTVIQQIKTCNQAIIIFQPKKDGSISNNLYFELGYGLALYGNKKLHCVKKTSDDISLPTDFDNAFVQPIESTSDDDVAKEIVEYFIGRQKMSINENKMFLINNRYIIHDKIISHYSEAGSKCSDYELAQYILFYMQAAHMFSDEKDINKELLEFKQLHHFEFSAELSLAVNISLSFFDLVTNIKVNEKTSEPYVDISVFWRFKQAHEFYESQIIDDETGIFDEWARIFIYGQLDFAYMLLSNNDEFSQEQREATCKEELKYSKKALYYIDELLKTNACKENNDEIGLVSLYKAYIFRNVFLAKKCLGDEDAGEWLKKTLAERSSLKNNFSNDTIDSQLYQTFCMEYYLSVVNYATYNSEVDPFVIMMYKQEMEKYLQSIKQSYLGNVFIKQIEKWCLNS